MFLFTIILILFIIRIFEQNEEKKKQFEQVAIDYENFFIGRLKYGTVEYV